MAGNELAETNDAGCHSVARKDCCIMVRDAVQSGKSIPMFRGVWLLP